MGLTGCPRIGKLFGACKWSPRYDLGPADVPDGTKVSGSGAISTLLDGYRTKTYVRDVCTTCGRTVERQSPQPE